MGMMRAAAGSVRALLTGRLTRADEGNRIMDGDNTITRGMVATNLQWVRKGLVIASVDLEIPSLGFKFIRCTWGRKADGTYWVAPPRRSWTSRQGQTYYAPMLAMSGATHRRFQDAALDAIRDYLLEGGAELP